MKKRAAPLHPGALLLTAAFASWAITVAWMRGMDAGPGTSLGGLGWFLGVWVTMMAAMMLPAAAPVVLLYRRLARGRRTSVGATSLFLVSYLAAWTLYGLVAYGLNRLVVSVGTEVLAWNRAGRYVAGGAVAAAGLYELTPLKSICLRYCRSPLHFLLGSWRDGPIGTLRMGAQHASYCVGCCWGLMLVLFALGVMSLTWMAVIAALIVLQKVAPGGERSTSVCAAAFLAVGILLAAAPDRVPGLMQPHSNTGMSMRP